jgi:hypothetical protein
MGEAERYLEFVFLPSVVALVKTFSELGGLYRVVVYGTVATGLITVPVYIWAFRNEFYNGDREKCLDEVIDALAERESGTVLLQPIWKGRKVAWETHHKVVDSIMNGNSTPESVDEFSRLFPRNYGVVTGDINWLEETFDPDWVVFDRSKSEDIISEELTEPEDEPKFENEYFSVYHFNDMLE